MSENINIRVRFRVLARDNFTCQYCGRKPPEVVLHVDHIIPHTAGQLLPYIEENLVTACRQCNLGKMDMIIDKNTIPRFSKEKDNE